MVGVRIVGQQKLDHIQMAPRAGQRQGRVIVITRLSIDIGILAD